MIKEKTVFVFGAGLSSDYGFPRHSDLRNKITDLLRNREQIEMLNRLSFDAKEIIKFREELEDGNFDTIDEFLEKRKKPKCRLLGKTAIAMVLIMYEHPNISKRRDSENCFYRFLFKRMVEGTTKETFNDNAVSFVTYNYDRSFEFFLWRALCRHYEDIQRYEADNIMKGIKITHVHGMLGFMHWQNPNSRTYDNKLDDGNLLLARSEIINFNDVDSNHVGYKDARKDILEAKNVVFVGFGFHPLNLSRLVEGNCLWGKEKILATALGIDDKKIKEVNQLTKGKLNSGNMAPIDAVKFAKGYLGWL